MVSRFDKCTFLHLIADFLKKSANTLSGKIVELEYNTVGWAIADCQVEIQTSSAYPACFWVGIQRAARSFERLSTRAPSPSAGPRVG